MDQSIKVVLEILKTELNENFDGLHAASLGAFEVKHLHSWLNDSEPILVDLVRFDEEGQKTTGRSVFQASRAPDYAQKEHQVHLVCKSGAEIVEDRLITMAVGEQKSADVVLSESIDTYEYWWFDETGHVIAHEEANFIAEMHLNMQPVGRTVEIKDKLTERASQVDRDLGKRISKVQAHSSQRSVISQRSHQEARRFEQVMKNVTGRIFPKSSRDRFFEKGIEDEVGVIKRFSSLINAGRVKKAVLVDPFFSPEALVRLVARIESTNVELSVICSWARIDPDTGKDMEPDEGPINLLSNALRLAGEIINPKLRILNLQHKRDQAFHDRYLLLYPHEGLPEVYLLSNSINKMSGNWPFCMSLLATDVALKVQAYIEGLEQGKDIFGCTSPIVSFEWPMNDV